ncbi:MAG TPA: FecR domain-containing protein [Bryobacteraceae bacterium]|nr:FecR domain-containing protein [Bryobacteraceae bacterium]
MNSDNPNMDPALEQAVSEIRGEEIPAAVVEDAARRVWARLSHAPERLRTCADFQALLPDFRAGRLPEARSLLVQDHLRECVACRNVAEGKVVPIPVRKPARANHPMRWAVAAGVMAVGGLVVWFSITQFGRGSGRAIVQSVNGTLYEVSPAGLRVMAAGEVLRDGIEVRTARDSGAMLALADGSKVEMRERSDFSTAQNGGDLTVHLDHGSIIVQAAKRRSGHLYVATADCRVAVTGTVFSVSSGIPGSRVSVMEGEVHLSHDNREQVLHPGEQAFTGDRLEAVPIRQDLSWSRNEALQHQLALLRTNLDRLQMPQVRYSSRLAGLLPATTLFFASIPNLAGYLGNAEEVFRKQAADSPELGAWLSGPGAGAQLVLEKLRAANEYLGDEIVIFATPETNGPMFLAEVKREGFPEFLKKLGLPMAVETRGAVVVFGARNQALATLLDSGLQKTPFYARIMEAYQQGTGVLLCADLSRMGPHPPEGIRYLIAEQTDIDHHVETRAAVTFDGARKGVAAWLAPPSPMGALDYVTADATFVSAFAVTSPAEILDRQPEVALPQPGFDLLKEAASTLGGEFAIALDGPPFPVPSWKLVAEVYDPARFQAALGKFVAEYSRDAAAHGRKPPLTGQETVDGRTYYTLAGADTGPLTEAHYTFASGYLIAAPTRALLVRALESKTNGTGIVHSPAFTRMLPRDPHTNFSAVVFQNLGTTLAPIAGLFGGQAASLGNLQPSLIAAYADSDRITLASTGDLLGMKLNTFLSGSVSGIAGGALPFAQLLGTNHNKVPSR